MQTLGKSTPANPPGYCLLQPLGQGGFGLVYKALKLSTQQLVAIKFLNIDAQEKDQQDRHIARFKKETQLSSLLEHPNIVRLLDNGQLDDGQLYAVFEYVDGVTLKDYIREQGALAPVEASDIMYQVLEALAYAHGRGIIHRDIKPANIMLTNLAGRVLVKVLDYGIGTFTQELRPLGDRTVTLTLETLGTPAYSAPEQLRGEIASPKTDLYLWGLVFIECLTGEQAVTGASVASIVQKQLSVYPITLPSFLTGHPVATLLRRVLHKKVQERAGQAIELLHELKIVNFSSLAPYKVPQQLVPHDEWGMTQFNISGALATARIERKQLTIMSLRFSLKNAPETADVELIDTLLRDQKIQCKDIAEGYGGFYLNSLSNTQLYYFGYPKASDNDARLCARAALEIVGNIISRQHFHYEICVHIGINTGATTLYSDEAPPDGINADCALELAFRAPPNTIICAQSTQRVLDVYSEFEPFDPESYLLVGERQVEAFGFLRSQQAKFELVGREQEISQIQQFLLPTAEIQNPRHVHIYGEAGIGKSRLVFEARNHSKHDYHLIAQCLPEYQHSGLFPILKLLRLAYGLDGLAVDAAHSKLSNLLKGLSNPPGALHLLCIWLSLPVPEESPILTETPDAQKQLLFQIIFYLLMGIYPPDRSILLIVEDIHWADNLTLDFLLSCLDQPIRGQNQLKIISTSRRELPSGFAQAGSLALPVKKLTVEQVHTFLSILFANQTLSSRLTALVVERADGVPLFIEELVAMLQQKQLIYRLNGIVDLVNPALTDQIPITLNESLQQKLDGLKTGKDTAQLAAVIGREFSYALLLEASSHAEDKLQIDLQELINNDLIYLQRKVHGNTYIFKHALVRDAAYHSTSGQVRQMMHLTIAMSLERTGGELSGTILAQHWAKGGDYTKAVRYGFGVAQAALKRASASEAIEEALNVLGWIEQATLADKTEKLLEIYRLLTSAYMELKGWASEEVLQYTQASLELLKATQNYDELVSHFWWQMINGIVGGRRAPLAKLSQEMDSIVDHVSAINRSALRCAQGFYQYTEGDRNLTIRLLTEAIEAYDPHADTKHQQIFGFDVKVFAKATLARAYADQLNDGQALRIAQEAVQEAKAFEHIPSIGIALMYFGMVHQHYQNTDEVKQSASELLAICDRYNLPIYRGFAQMLFDWAIGDTSDADEILDFLVKAGSRHGLGQFQSYYAQLYLSVGNFAKALDKINECLELDRETQEENYIAKLLMIKAEIMAQMDVEGEVVRSICLECVKLAEIQGFYRVRDHVVSKFLSILK